jgi:predicted phage-related endonuclease
MMEIHNLVQGSPEWHAHRSRYHNASEAAAMLGLSKNVTRDELIRMKATGTEQEFGDWVQRNILDKGHEYEAKARAIMEKIIGQELFPVTGTSGTYSASFDGLTMCERIGFEHKQWNEELAAYVQQGIVPDTHMPQVQQQIMVGDLEKVIFTVSDGTAEKMVYAEVKPDPEWFQRLILGWEQFDKEVAAYVPAEVKEKPVAEVIKALPTLVIQLQGSVVSSNLPEFKKVADEFIANIKTDLQSDQDFADAEAMVKFLKEGEDSLERAKMNALGQTASIDELMRTIDHIKETMRSKRLVLDKAVSSEKDKRRGEILERAKREWAVHVASIEEEIQPIQLMMAVPDFAGAMKGKKTIASLNNAVNTLMAQSKIEAEQLGKGLRAKLAWIKATYPDHGFLFRDLQQIITKPAEDFHLLVNTRVNDHEVEQRKKREAEEAAAKDAEQSKQAIATPATETVQTGLALVSANDEGVSQSIIPTKEVVDDGSTMKLGDIAALLGFPLSAQFIEEELGIKPAGKERTAVLFNCRDFPAICDCLVANVNAAKVDFIEQRKAA